jgi:hypothetical protein
MRLRDGEPIHEKGWYEERSVAVCDVLTPEGQTTVVKDRNGVTLRLQDGDTLFVLMLVRIIGPRWLRRFVELRVWAEPMEEER